MLRPATFILKLYKADDLPRSAFLPLQLQSLRTSTVLVDSAFFHGVKKIFHAAEDIKELIDPYVTFSFAGQQVQSKIVYTCSHPDFNQELRLGLKVSFRSSVDRLGEPFLSRVVSVDVR